MSSSGGLALLFGLGLSLCLPGVLRAQDGRDLDELVRRGDTYLDPDTFEPYSGPVTGWWEAGAASSDSPRTLRERGVLVEGKWDGTHEWFHLSGDLATMETYRNGRLNGPSETYFKTGQLSAKENYANGQLHGAYESYWHRGRLAERGSWNAGEPCGNWLSFGRTVIYPPCPGG